MENKKKKLLWIGDYGFSGYSLVANCLLKSILKYVDVYLLVINTQQDRAGILNTLKVNNLEIPEQNVFNVERTVVKDEKDVDQLMGYYKIPFVLNKVNPDIIISINDLQYLVKHMNSIKKCKNWSGLTIAYTPIDSEDQPATFFDPLKKWNHVITMNEISKKRIFEADYYNHVYVLEHPIRNSFYDDKINKLKHREEYFATTNIKPDDIVIMNVNVNSTRKRIDLTLESFYLLHVRKNVETDNIHLVLKMKLKGEYDIVKLTDDLNKKYEINLKSKIVLIDNKLTYEKLNELYNCADLYLTTTSGEGWGLTAFEFLKTNTWTIVPDNISYTDYFPDILKSETVKDSLGQCRKGLKRPDKNIFIILMTIEKSDTHEIKEEKVIPDNGYPKLILSPDKVNNVFDLVKLSKINDKMQVVVLADTENDFKFFSNIISQFYKLDLHHFFKDHRIDMLRLESLNHYIISVKKPKLDSVVEKIEYYIKNKEKCDNDIKKYSESILKNLSDDKIGEDFKKILIDINSDLINES